MSKKLVIAAIVLAAGRSTRMGEVNKLLVEHKNQPMIARTLSQVITAGIEPVIVVVGHQAQDIQAALSDFDVEFVFNGDFRDGLSTSIKTGVAGLGGDVDGVFIILGDMPLVDEQDIRALVSAFETSANICVPMRNGRRGNPVLWGRDYFLNLQKLQGDKGARDLILAKADEVVEVEMSGDRVLQDFDSPADFASS